MLFKDCYVQILQFLRVRCRFFFLFPSFASLPSLHIFFVSNLVMSIKYSTQYYMHVRNGGTSTVASAMHVEYYIHIYTHVVSCSIDAALVATAAAAPDIALFSFW